MRIMAALACMIPPPAESSVGPFSGRSTTPAGGPRAGAGGSTEDTAPSPSPTRTGARGRRRADGYGLSASCTLPTILAPGSTRVLSPSSFHFEGQTSLVFLLI